MTLFHRPLPRTLDAAIRDLKEPRSEVRRSAIADLARHVVDGSASEQVVRALTQSLRDDDPIVRKDAAYALGDAHIESALPNLLVAVDDTDSRVRQAAIDALGQLGDSRALTRLQRALRDDRPDVRFQAVIALARISTDQVEDAIRLASEDPDEHVRYICVRVVEEHLATCDDSKTPPRVVASVRDAAHEWLRDDGSVGFAAAILLGRLGDDSGGDKLVQMASGRVKGLDAEDEAAAIELVASLGLRDGIPMLEERAFGWSWKRILGDRFLWHVLVALASMGNPRATRSILQGLDARSSGTRAMAVMAVGRARIKEARETLEHMLGNRGTVDPELIEEALRALDGDD